MNQLGPLTADVIKNRYESEGFVFPHRVIPSHEALGLREQVESLFQSSPQATDYARGLAHLVFPVIDQIAHDERVIDVAQAVSRSRCHVVRCRVFSRKHPTRQALYPGTRISLTGGLMAPTK